MGGGATGYTAFLSYSHNDAAAANRLHRRLEAYRVPRRLVGSEGARGPVPARLAPIFRDREELPAASDLTQEVRTALAASQALVVVCSPHSAASTWVGREITVFRELHPDRPILAAILDGEPSQCFPPDLTRGPAGEAVEPLAADLRRDGDGERLGLLKLVAGLAGVPLDALVQRDAQRRIRRVTAVTAAALAAMLAMAVMTTLALTARAEAQRQRAEAEGLVEFMLTDLRRELRKVGRLDIMGVVNQRALSYYSGRESDSATASLAIRARADQTTGEDLLTRGDVEAALRLFHRAHQRTGAFLEVAPDDPRALFAHAQSEYWIGRAHELRQEWVQTEYRYRRFADLTSRMITADPTNPDYMMQMGWAAVDLGNVQLNGSRDAEAAQRSYEQAVSWFGRAADERPNDLRARLAHANAFGWLADSYFMREQWPESLTARLRQYEIVEALHREDPSNLESLYRFAIAQRAVARSYSKIGNVERARPLVFGAHMAAGRLTNHDPDNAEWILFKGFVACDLYFGEVGFPRGASRNDVRQDIAHAAGRLRALGNPRAAEMAACVKASAK